MDGMTIQGNILQQKKQKRNKARRLCIWQGVYHYSQITGMLKAVSSWGPILNTMS